MNKIEELIQKLCPDGVEFKKIQDVCHNVTSGGTPLTSKNEYYGGVIPWLRTQEVDWKDILDTGIKITEEGLKNSSSKLIPTNCVIVAMYGATAAKVAINKIPLCTNQACCNLEIDEEQANYKYVFYWLCHKYINLKALGEGSQSNINSLKVKTFQIPIPPLPIQQEIVTILDKFTSLEAELEAELEARTHQYDYYRNHLLSFEDEEIEWVEIENVFDMKNGYTPSKANSKFWNNGSIPWFRMEDIRENGRILTDSFQHITEDAVKGSGLFPANSIIVSTSATIGEHALITVDFLSNQRFTCLTCKREYRTKLNMLFFQYYMFIVDEWCKKNINISGFAGVDMVKFKKLKIPIPPLSEQNRIVSLLDKFDALVNDISAGLPAEIAARRKQYEYYREKLLTFKKAN